MSTSLGLPHVAEPDAEYVAEIDYDNEHRYAEHEHEAQMVSIDARCM